MPDISTKKSRQKLPEGLHWQRLSRTLSLGYRKGKRRPMWWGREFIDGGYRKESLTVADDLEKADGVEVLSHAQAINKAVNWAKGPVRRSLHHTTVGDVVDAYLEHYKAETRDETLSQVNTAKKWITEDLRSIGILTIESDDLLKWRNGLVTKGRVRKATANRIWTVLRAALNFGYDYMDIPKPERWRKVKPFQNANKPRAEYLTIKQSQKLIAKMDPDFKALALGALYTGGRYRELTLMRIRDVDVGRGQVHFENTKSGNARTVPLSDEGNQHFRTLVKDRKGGEYVFVRADGEGWRKSHQMRRMRDASMAAKFEKPINFHQFRHTYASVLTQSGMTMRTIQELLGHADMRITVQHYSHLHPDHVAEQVRQHLPSFTK